MGFKNWIKSAAAAALLGASSIASAGLVTYDFTGGGPNANSLIFSEAGLDLRVDGFFGNSPRTISWGTTGLGIVGNGSDQLNSPFFSFEELEFYLPTGATWHSATLRQFRAPETVAYCASIPGTSGCSSPITTVNAISGVIDEVLLDNIANASTFSFFSNRNQTGNLRIGSITVDVATVPAPATLGLLGLGLLGLGFARRTRNA